EVRLRSAVFELGVGRELIDWAEVRAGFRVGSGDTKLRVGDPSVIPFDSFHRGSVFARFSVDTLDSISFPRRGAFATFEWRGSSTGVLGADQNFDQLLINAAYAKSWSRHTLLTRFRYDTTISGEAPIFNLFGIGGFLDLSGLNTRQFTGEHATRLGASYYRQVGDLALFPAFVGMSVEVGNAWQSRSDISLNGSIWGGSIWAGVDTPVGPVVLAYGDAEGGHSAFYVSLGRLF
ncbi:MAG: hypothetical protein R3305_05375, partial [Gammaproteobacteria bacterium]|nr:hypothetical protein [Gammaproteobacteria bacterium]